MTETKLKPYAPFAAVAGLAGLLAAAIIWLIQQQLTPLVQASLAVGLLGLALALLFNPAAVQTFLGGRQARYGGNVLVMVLALVGIVTLVNYLAYTNPQRWDWTADQTNTLAPETLEVLHGMQQPARAVAFYSANFPGSQDTARRLLERYQVESRGQFTYEFYDPLGDPVRANEYGITRDGTIVVEMGIEREELTFATEEQLTGALVRLANPGTRVVYFLTGHGERGIVAGGEEGMFTGVDLLGRQNYEVQALNLQVTTTVPADARAVVVAGPLVPVTQAEVDIIRQYVDGGGSLVVLLDPLIQTQTEPGTPEPLVEYLAEAWGVRVTDDVVVDLFNSYPDQPLFPLNSGYGANPITDRLQGIATVYPVARSVVLPPAGAGLPGLTATPLVLLDSRAWGETNFDSLSEQAGPQLDPTDTQPPLVAGAAVENTQTGARLVVFGDSDFASDVFANQGANANLMVNSVNWVTADGDTISIIPRPSTQRSLALTDTTTVRMIFLLTVILMPLAVLVAGGLVWFRRRRRL